MHASSSARMGIVAFLAILTVSAGTMLWLFWRYPLHNRNRYLRRVRRARGVGQAGSVHRWRNEGSGSNRTQDLMRS